jgi:hypothetical protein
MDIKLFYEMAQCLDFDEFVEYFCAKPNSNVIITENAEYENKEYEVNPKPVKN